MKRLTQEEANERLRSLPNELRTALDSVDTEKEIEAIGIQCKLHVDEVGLYAEMVVMVMLGALPAKDFLANLKEALPRLDQESFLKLAEETNKRIFFKVREALQKFDKGSVVATETVKVEDNSKLKVQNVNLAQVTVPAVPEAKPSEVKAVDLAGIVERPSTTTDISHENLDPRVKMIPSDVKARINSDPYREPIE